MKQIIAVLVFLSSILSGCGQTTGIFENAGTLRRVETYSFQPRKTELKVKAGEWIDVNFNFTSKYPFQVEDIEDVMITLSDGRSMTIPHKDWGFRPNKDGDNKNGIFIIRLNFGPNKVKFDRIQIDLAGTGGLIDFNIDPVIIIFE